MVPVLNFDVLRKYKEFRGHATRWVSAEQRAIEFPSIFETSTFERQRSLPLTVTSIWACDTHQLAIHGMRHQLPVSIRASRAPTGGTFRKCRFRTDTRSNPRWQIMAPVPLLTPCSFAQIGPVAVRPHMRDTDMRDTASSRSSRQQPIAEKVVVSDEDRFRAATPSQLELEVEAADMPRPVGIIITMEDLEFGLVGRDPARRASLVLVSPRHAVGSLGKTTGMSPRCPRASPLGKSASGRGMGTDGHEDSPRPRSAASKHSRLALVFGAADSPTGDSSLSRSNSGRQRSGSGRPVAAQPPPLQPPHNLPSLNLSRIVGGMSYSGGREAAASPRSSGCSANHISHTGSDNDDTVIRSPCRATMVRSPSQLDIYCPPKL